MQLTFYLREGEEAGQIRQGGSTETGEKKDTYLISKNAFMHGL